MNANELNWRNMKELPDAGTTVLIHVPHDDEPVWFGFWDGRRWHYIEGLPVRGEVKHWCGVPMPPDRDWMPMEDTVASRLTSDTVLPLANAEPVLA